MKQSFFQKVMGSLVGSLFGLGLFLLAFGVIWWNEGKTNLADVAHTSLSVSAEQIDGVNEGKWRSHWRRRFCGARKVSGAGAVCRNVCLGGKQW